LLSKSVEYVFLSDEAISLADVYITHGAVTEKHLIDAQHTSGAPHPHH
jgi:hypothetical protein